MSQSRYVYVFLVSLLLLPISVFGANKHSESELYNVVYIQQHEYPGIFDSERIYKLQSSNSNWRGSSAPQTLRQVRCGSAESALTVYGIWFGRLTAKGKCQDGDPIDWAMGNYLNFMGNDAEESN